MASKLLYKKIEQEKKINPGSDDQSDDPFRARKQGNGSHYAAGNGIFNRVWKSRQWRNG